VNLYAYAANSPLNFTDETGLSPDGGSSWASNYAQALGSNLNPSNPNGTFSQEAVAMGQSLEGLATGNLAQVAQSYDNNPLGQTAAFGNSNDAFDLAGYYGTRAALIGAAAADLAAGTLIGLEAAGMTDIGEAEVGWKGGEITLTRPGSPTPDIRINPFGDDNWPPHYHRRPGIGKHRPWEGWALLPFLVPAHARKEGVIR
jgi:hypothetical protein